MRNKEVLSVALRVFLPYNFKVMWETVSPSTAKAHIPTRKTN
jgi:hypothetical protein